MGNQAEARNSSKGYGLSKHHPYYAPDSSEATVTRPVKRKRAPPLPRGGEARPRIPREKRDIEAKKRKGEEYLDEQRSMQDAIPQQTLQQKPQQQPDTSHSDAIHYPQRPTEQAIQAQLLGNDAAIVAAAAVAVAVAAENSTHLLPPLSKKRKLNSNIANSFLGTPSARLGIIPAAVTQTFRALGRVSGFIICAAGKSGVEAVRHVSGAICVYVDDVKKNVALRAHAANVFEGQPSVQGQGGGDGDKDEGFQGGGGGNDDGGRREEEEESDSDDDDDYYANGTPRPSTASAVRLPAPRPVSDLLPNHLIPSRMPRTAAAQGDGSGSRYSWARRRQGRGIRNTSDTVSVVRRDAGTQTESVSSKSLSTRTGSETVVHDNSKRSVQLLAGAGEERVTKGRKNIPSPSPLPPPPPPLPPPRPRVQRVGLNVPSPMSRLLEKKETSEQAPHFTHVASKKTVRIASSQPAPRSKARHAVLRHSRQPDEILEHDDRNRKKMQRTKTIIHKIWEEQCIAGIAQQYIDGVAELRQQAIANGRAFPQGLSGWHEMSEAEQQRVTWATRAIEENERLHRSRSSSAAPAGAGAGAGADRIAALQAAGGGSQDADIQEQQRQPAPVPEIDQALVARFGTGGPHAGLLRTLAAQRDYFLFARRRWPDDMTGWADKYSDQERQLVLEATRYMEQQEAIEDSMQQPASELLDDESSSENDE